MSIAPLFTSARHDWRTPRWLFDRLHAEFAFTLDAAADKDNALCSDYYTVADDALRQPWTGSVFVNPPYGRDIGRWVEKAQQGTAEGAHVVMLVPARTDTQFFHRGIWPYSHEIRFIEGRLKFDDGATPAPFPSMVVVFSPWHAGPPRVTTMRKSLETPKRHAILHPICERSGRNGA